MVLFGLGLDSGKTADALFSLKPTRSAIGATSFIRSKEPKGFVGMTREQVEAYDREWKAFYRKWSGEG
jgi:hypothetical protein